MLVGIQKSEIFPEKEQISKKLILIVRSKTVTVNFY